MDVPTDFSSVAERLSEADRAVLSISAMFYDERVMVDLELMIEAEPTDLDHGIDTLPPDADEVGSEGVARQVRPPRTDEPEPVVPGWSRQRIEAIIRRHRLIGAPVERSLIADDP
ncbi:hypothetical protein [Nocardiopsis sp. MG754419]|uniref:hypothetical protein n=1 Tax=Nocardiopsis sp. MG754419 TaxID=2259865 RepID=UPI001BA8117E|nr:hypothetical protein [Nocardiopsis sp. MG754419]MBR8740782.1 hypothetical protein [Nocardiopsis sp. MG754419]